MTKVFISYSRRDLDFVERLAKDLKASGLEVWYDLSDLLGGDEWMKAIEGAVRQSQFFIIVLSPNSAGSKWVEREFLYAENLKLKIIPLVHAPCELPIWALDLQYIDMQGKNYELRFNDLLKSLVAQRPPPPPPDIPPIDLKQLESKAIQYELRGDFWNALQIYYQIKAKDPQYPRVDVKIRELEKELQPKESIQTAQPRPLGRPARTPRSAGKKAIFASLGAAAVLVVCGVGLFILFKILPIPPRPNPTPVPPTRTSIPRIPTHTLQAKPTATRIPEALTPTLGIGSIWTSPIDGMVMVFVPAGPFTMGSNTGESNAQPAHTVYLDYFWIDQTDVTNAMYAKCAQAGKCAPPAASSSYSRPAYYGNLQYDNYPVIYVDWNMANTYCAWAARRLPTEAEWEKAARGTDGRIYPWGNAAPNANLLNYNSNVGDTTEVRKYPGGVSPYGAYDMAGNVWQWLADWYSDTYYQNSPSSNPPGPNSGDLKVALRVVRGIDWKYDGNWVLAFDRGGMEPSNAYYDKGFRCAWSASK